MRKFGFVLPVLLLFGVVLSGCDNGNKDEKEEETKGFTLTITGLTDPAKKIYGASLFDQNVNLNNPTEPPQPVAAGMGVGGKFTFCHYKEGDIPIDFDRPFVTPGTYKLAIALTTWSNPQNYEAVYIYSKNDGKVTFSNSIKNLTLGKSDFTPQP